MDLWPTVGSIWNSEEEVLLACRLAAAKVGFGELLRQKAPSVLGRSRSYIRCIPKELEKHLCSKILVILDFTPGSSTWKVSEVRRETLLGECHKPHLRVEDPTPVGSCTKLKISRKLIHFL